ncbi:MAG TPA: hypothetical protein VGE36_04430 [Roseateles sp.]
MPRLLFFVVGLALLGFTFSFKVGFWLAVGAAVVWCGAAVWSVAALAAPLPRRQQQRGR